MNPQLIDEIYESSFLPERWPGVLGQLAEIAGGRGGVLFVTNVEVASAAPGILRWTGSESMREDLEVYVHEGWIGRDPRVPRLMFSPHAGFLADESLLSEAELGTNPTILGYYRARGLGRGAITGVRLPTGDAAILSVEREYVRGPVGAEAVAALDGLRPHLLRSALVSSRLQLERARAASEALSLIGLPALVFNERGVVLAANALIEALTDHVRWRAHGRVAFRDPGADELFTRSIETIGIDAAPSIRSLVVRDADSRPAFVGHILPIRRQARDLFNLSAGVLVLTPVTLPNAPPVDLIQSLFDLSPAEARVARELATGATVDEIAGAAETSPYTVRAQVRAILQKTGLHRQVEVVALLGGLNLSRG